jgi:hypothetical protein
MVHRKPRIIPKLTSTHLTLCSLAIPSKLFPKIAPPYEMQATKSAFMATHTKIPPT